MKNPELRRRLDEVEESLKAKAPQAKTHYVVHFSLPPWDELLHGRGEHLGARCPTCAYCLRNASPTPEEHAQAEAQHAEHNAQLPVEFDAP